MGNLLEVSDTFSSKLISFHKIPVRSDMGPSTLIMAEGHNFNDLFVLTAWKMSDVTHYIFKLKNIHTSACLNLNYGTIKQKQKMSRLVEFIMTRDQWPRKLNFGYFWPP